MVGVRMVGVKVTIKMIIDLIIFLPPNECECALLLAIELVRGRGA
jgi:hypothetical protein